MENFTAALAVAGIFWVVMWGAFGSWIAGQKSRRGEEGLILGLIFGPIGVLVEAMLPDPAQHAANMALSNAARRNESRSLRVG